MSNQVEQPLNTPTFKLAREIPAYRQAKLSGHKYPGAIRNIAPQWSQVNATAPYMSPDEKAQPIKQQPTMRDGVMSNTQTATVKTNSPISQPPIQTENKGASPKHDTNTEQINNQSRRLTQQLRSKEQELLKMRELSSVQSGQMRQLTNQKKTAEAVIQNLKQQLTNLESNNIDEHEINTMKDKIEQKEDETAQLHQEIDRLNKSIVEESKLEDQVTAYRNQIKILLDQQKKLEELVNQGESRLKTLDSQLQTEQKEKGDREGQIRKLERLLEDTITSSLNPPVIKKKIVNAEQGSTLKLPIMTKLPNAISGVVTDKKGQFLPETIVMIKNSNGQNLRALKTNQLGQFVVTTPLPNNKYFIEVSKTGHSFDIVEITLTGGIVPPVQINSYELTT